MSRFSSSSSWTESSFEINVLLESSTEAQTSLSDLRAITTKTETQNQIDAGRTEDRANQKGKKNWIYVVRSVMVRLVMVETKLMVS